MEYNSKIQRKELLLHATWINCEDIMLSEESLTHKSAHCVVPFM